jgi:hypothetical protein
MLMLMPMLLLPRFPPFLMLMLMLMPMLMLMLGSWHQRKQFSWGACHRYLFARSGPQ